MLVVDSLACYKSPWPAVEEGKDPVVVVEEGEDVYGDGREHEHDVKQGQGH